MGIFKLIDNQTFGDQPGMNVWFFRSLQGSGSASGAIEIFVENILPPMLVLQHTSVTHTRVDCINMIDPSDFASLTLGALNVGTAGGTLATSMLAWSIRLNRSSLLIKNGFKRIGGVAESQLNGQVIETLVLDEMQTFLDTLGPQYQDADDNTYELGILKSPVPPDVVSGFFPVFSASYMGVGSQVSRKRRFSS